MAWLKFTFLQGFSSFLKGFIHLFWMSSWEREKRKRHFLSAGSLARCYQQLGLGWAWQVPRLQSGLPHRWQGSIATGWWWWYLAHQSLIPRSISEKLGQQRSNRETLKQDTSIPSGNECLKPAFLRFPFTYGFFVLLSSVFFFFVLNECSSLFHFISIIVLVFMTLIF